MTSPSNDKTPVYTPHERLSQSIGEVADLLIVMKKMTDEAGFIKTEALSEFMCSAGQLVWISGAIESAIIMTGEEDGPRIIN